ncbi:MAG: hypothetical protein CVT63_00940 [Candidatus Anoxymicrobium japonicum]|uniref:AraC effector-binding domain-containing protein n=1 Tax=Candidatus Anoxymicrobium japonicum TaxID=2013648 RepID=A0A2N3G7S3_9ACTN|nr:MAG: hypothetical protein CVT63_00940 [Candidatus Anoxymicrobium japonicum]
MDQKIEIKEYPPQPVLSMRGQIQLAELAGFFGDAFSKLLPYLAGLSESPVAPLFAVYHGAPTEQGVDVEVCVPTGALLAGSGEIKASELPGGDFASTIHAGPYERISSVYEDIMKWMAENGYRPSGPSREVYIVGAGQANPADYITEVLFPIAKT